MSTRICVAGTGFFSQFHYEAWARLDVEVAAVCSLDTDSAAEVAVGFDGCRVFDDFARMLDDVQPDLVDIVTPPPTHLEFVTACVGRGIPAICQKPFCGGLEDAEKAAKLAAEAGVPVIVHENFRFQPWFTEIARRLADGDLGEVYQGTFRLRPGDGQGADAYLSRQPYFQTMPRLLVHETLVHLIDVFRFLFGEVAAVNADLRRLNPVIKGEDAGIIILTFTDGRRAVIDGNRLVDHAAKNRRLVMGEMLVEGSAGVLRLDGDARLFERPFAGNDEAPLTYDWADNGYGGDCVYLLNRHVLNCLAEAKTPMNTAQAYLANLRIVEAVYRSAEEGRRVDL
jgi:predicted dehydrogenase